MSKIDPSSREVEGSVKVGPSTYGLSVGGGFVWATSPDGGDLTRIDPDASVGLIPGAARAVSERWNLGLRR